MEFEPFLDSLEGLDEAFHAAYTEKDGKFWLGVKSKGGYSLENVEGLKTSLGKERSNAEKAGSLLKKFACKKNSAGTWEVGDWNPARVKDALSKMDEVANWTSDEKVKETLEARDREHQQRLEKVTTDSGERITFLTSQLERNLVRGDAVAGLTKHGAHPEGVELALPHLMSQLKMSSDKDGNFVTRVHNTGKDGWEISMRQGAHDLMMSAEEAAERMKGNKTFESCFNGTGATGSGAKGSTGETGGLTRFTLSSEDARDTLKYREVRAAAEKAGQTVQITE